MKPQQIFALTAVMLFLPFCKTTKVIDAPKPPEHYLSEGDQPLQSFLTIPVNISVYDLMQSINNRLSGKALYEDYSYTDNGGDNFMINAWKSREITLNLSGQTIKYYVPVKLWMKKNLYVGEAEAEGELAIAFKTTFTINSDWSLKTNTEVEYHEWLTKPYLKTGVGNISIESLANLAINRSKKEMSASIDRVVSQQLSLRPYVEDVWKAIQEPTLLSEEYKIWVKTTPTAISMSPMATDWNNIRTKIAIQCLNDVTFGDKPSFRENSHLPNFTYINEADAPDEFQVRIATDVPFPEAERLAKGMVVGQVFESAGKKVTVDDLHIWGNDDKMVINTKLSGSFNGNIYFIGRPTFNAEKNQVEMDDLDFHIDTKNVLYKSASWLFQGPIRKKMEDAMTFPLADNIRDLRNEVQNSLSRYELSTGITLTGTVDTLNVENTHITPTSIRVDLFSKGKVQVDVKGL